MKVAVTPYEATGHVNPLLALCKKLRERGHEVQFFIVTDLYEKELLQLGFETHLFGEERGVRHTPQSMFELIPMYQDQDETDRLILDHFLWGYAKALDWLPKLLDKLKDFQPDLIIFDAAWILGAYAAYLLDIPCVSLITLPGFNVYPLLMGRHTEEEKDSAIEEMKTSKFLQKYYKQFEERYHFDAFDVFVPASYYLRNGLQICTAIKEFDLPMPRQFRKLYGGLDEDCVYVGPMLLTEKEGRLSSMDVGPKCEHQWIDEPFPHDQLKKYKEQGKKIIYVSFGTNAPGAFWNFYTTERKLIGARSIGKDFCHALWKRIFEVLGANDKYAVVLASMSQDPDALKGFDIPTNFIIRRRCPQLEVLEVADAFITHGGANSVIESISAHVPMLVLPYFGDQFDNGAIVSREGVGLDHNNPVLTCTTEALKSNIERLLEDHDAFASNCKRLHKSLEEAGGLDKAGKCIEDYVASFKGHDRKMLNLSHEP